MPVLLVSVYTHGHVQGRYTYQSVVGSIYTGYTYPGVYIGLSSLLGVYIGLSSLPEEYIWPILASQRVYMAHSSLLGVYRAL